MTTVEGVAKWVTILATAGAFCWTVVSALQSHAIDARRPFLDLQLKLYQEATKTASVLATSDDTQELKAAEARFWQLYWGELGLVENGGIKSENGGVESAMVRFGGELQKGGKDRGLLKNLALALAHTCRNSLAQSWNVRDWQAPVYVAPQAKESPQK
jgi:hypothetical protein